MLTVYSQNKDQVVDIVDAWITSENEIVGFSTIGREIILGEFSTESQAQAVLNKIFDIANFPKLQIPRDQNVTLKGFRTETGYPKELEDKCTQCAYHALSMEELTALPADPCDTCNPQTLSNWQQKEKAR